MAHSLSLEAQQLLNALKAKTVLSRTEKQSYLFQYLQPDKGRGLEIGPNVRALVPKNSGYQIDYIESLSTEQLIDLVSKKSPHEIDLVPTIDYVAREGLAADTGKTAYYDYAVSSHVLEHLPNLIQHLQEVEKVLKEGGIYGLIIPDKTLTLDYLRPCSSFGQVLEAYLLKRTEASLGSYIDSLVYSVKNTINDAICWEAASPLDLTKVYVQHPRKIEHLLSFEQTKPPADWGGHVWVFTADSFISLFFDIKRFALSQFELIDIQSTGEADFIAVLAKPNSGYQTLTQADAFEQLYANHYQPVQVNLSLYPSS
ncbi:MAG: class I SAM-dependent methyltransferase [Thiothrix sp.]|nr:MAG: class I SAM-dependent methyltransferase [Thiothrix sp.]